MTETTIAEEHATWEAAFARLDETRRREPAWLRTRREEGFDRFTELGFPGPKNEDWKYTSVRPIERTDFAEAPTGVDLDAVRRRLDETGFEGLEGPRAVLVNGRFVPELSDVETPDGVEIGSLAAAVEEGSDLLEAHLDRHVRDEDDPFCALNLALFADGVLVTLEEGVVPSDPIRVVHCLVGDGSPFAVFPHSLVWAGRSSEATIVESFVDVDAGTAFHGPVIEACVGENATVHHYRDLREGTGTFHIQSTDATVARDGQFISHAVTFGGGLVRNNINVLLDGPGGDCGMNGLYMISGDQHVDNQTFIDHARPDCTSREFYKGILAGESRGVFNGKVYVHQIAQRTDGEQTNQALLLSRDAEIDSKPQLEIYADDVKCTHGATIGELDERALFYVRSRGIPLVDAQRLLTYGFATDILERMDLEPVRVGLERLAYDWFPENVEMEEADLL